MQECEVEEVIPTKLVLSVIAAAALSACGGGGGSAAAAPYVVVPVAGRTVALASAGYTYPT
ncbi:MAG: hypothetical protein RL302_1561, partial [Pseudomonadota bacterium]